MKKFRYSLRNQDKIAKSLGDDYLKLLLDSLKAYFYDRTKEVDEIGEVENNRPTGITYVLIPSVSKNSEIDFQFVLLSRTFNTYNLAYYSSIG